MITVEYCQTMARYNAWQNSAVSAALKSLPEKEVMKDRKAFFGSLFKTANHLLWGDQIWMSRFDNGAVPPGGIPDSTALHDNLQLLLDDRLRTDARIKRWASRLKHIDLVGPLVWVSATTGKSMTMPKPLCIAHFFNHQTHHRGQIHAMLTEAGYETERSDLVFMPE